MKKTVFYLVSMMAIAGCTQDSQKNEPVTLMVLAPGHFHASLVQKEMYPEVDSNVYVYAPEGMEVEDYLARVASYNSRAEDPTRWNEQVYREPDFLQRLLEEKPGNLVVLAGNNNNKIEYIETCIKNGLNVYSDKPMAITPSGYKRLMESMKVAEANGLLLYDIMTERYEITNMLQTEFSRIPELFGELEKGSLQDPAILKESVHHFFKFVSGTPLQRPVWFFDARQEGEAIADVGTHLVDLVLWGFYDVSAGPFEDRIRVLNSEKWDTPLSFEAFAAVTGAESYPGFLEEYLDGDTLRVNANSALDFTVDGIHVRLSVRWNYRAPEGGGDTHYSVLRGTRADLVIRQGAAENYRPELYIVDKEGQSEAAFLEMLETAYHSVLAEQYSGISFASHGNGEYRVNIPDRYRVGHEAHFGEVTRKFLVYMKNGTIPAREMELMKAKYFVTTRAVETAIRKYGID